MTVDEKSLCYNCIGEDYLKSEVEKSGQVEICSYCGKKAETFTLEKMADIFEIMFKDHFYQTSTEASGIEYAMGGDWERDGEPVVNVIADQATIEENVAEDILELLGDRHYDMDLAAMGEEGPFGSETQYAEAPVDSSKHDVAWSQFEKSLKTEARYFSPDAQKTLTSIFGGLEAHRTDKGQSVIVQAGPETRLLALYRARVFQSGKKLEKALKRPDLELGPPPWRDAKALRMNARGISVFYGATDAKTALAETRPPVGSHVLVGRFDLIRPLRLLDLRAFQTVNVKGSLFDRDFIRRLEKAHFLKSLGHRMTAPVMPDDEPFDYLATQVIAEFLATEATPSLDGIIYPSSQASGDNANVVLFHKSSRVEPLDIPVGTTISASLDMATEDGFEVDYTVFEEIPSAAASPKLVPTAKDDDGRKFTLRLEASTLQVHSVNAISVNTDSEPVKRHRLKKRDTPKEPLPKDWP